MSRRSDPIIAFDHEAGMFRTRYPTVRRATLDERPGLARASVSSLLMKEFGKPLRTTNATVPAHLRRYVQS